MKPILVTFGKHKGKYLHELPEDYFHWMINYCHIIRDRSLIELEGQRRGYSRNSNGEWTLEEKMKKKEVDLSREDLKLGDHYTIENFSGVFKVGAIYHEEYRRARKIDCALIPADNAPYKEVHARVDQMKKIVFKTLFAFTDSKKEIHWFSTMPTSAEVSKKKLIRNNIFDRQIQL